MPQWSGPYHLERERLRDDPPCAGMHAFGLTKSLPYRWPADDEPAPGSPVHSGPTPLHRKPRSSAEETMEAGDEEIDWDHTRMLSLGFFPSISTDQVRDRVS